MSLYREMNRPWEITSARGGTLRVGTRHVPLDMIRGIARSAHQERDFLPSLLNYSAYLTVAAIFLILVVQAGWRERFLLATIFAAIVGATSLVDVWQASRVRLYTLRIINTDGSEIEFTSADADEVDRLVAALARLGKR